MEDDIFSEHLVRLTTELLATKAKVTELDYQLEVLKKVLQKTIEGNLLLAAEAGKHLNLALNPGTEA